MIIHFATKNKGKVDSLSNTLSRYGIKVIQVPLDMPEPRSYDLREIAREKVLFAYKHIQKPCIALDTGFYIKSLKGFPRTFTNLILETIGIEGVLKLVEGKGRDCEFRDCLMFMDETLSEPVYFESSAGGRLSEAIRGKAQDHQWSDLNLIFIPSGENKTLAEMTYEEFHAWRAKSLEDSSAIKFAEWVSKRQDL